jgi:hypothetical protein
MLPGVGIPESFMPVTVEYADDLTGSWSLLARFAPGSGQRFYVDTTTMGVKRFYRTKSVTVGTLENTPMIVFVGDSLMTQMLHLEHPLDWYVTLPQYAGQSFEKHNIAVFGRKLSEMVKAAPINLYPEHHDNSGMNIAVIWAGTNELVPSLDISAGSIFKSLRQFSRDLQALGFRVLVCTLTSSSLDEPKRIRLNEYIRDFSPEYCDGIIDLGADAIIGGNGAYQDTAYFIDTLHMTNKGNAYVGSIINSAINKYIE